ACCGSGVFTDFTSLCCKICTATQFAEDALSFCPRGCLRGVSVIGPFDKNVPRACCINRVYRYRGLFCSAVDVAADEGTKDLSFLKIVGGNVRRQVVWRITRIGIGLVRVCKSKQRIVFSTCQFSSQLLHLLTYCR